MGVFDGRTVVITGAASGIGRALAFGFLDDGAVVVGTDVNVDGLQPIAEAGALTQRTDVSVDADVRAMIDRAVSESGRVDVLINNAGFGAQCPVEDLADGAFERMIAVHLFGCIYGMRAAIPIMRRQHHGRIINVISRAAEGGAPNNSAYGAAKAAMWAASRSAAAEVRDGGILVNMLFPGMTNTAIWGRDMPGMQDPSAAYPTARMLAALPADGPTGEVFYREQPYRMFDPANAELLARDREEIRQRARAADTST
jgi:NAD(P)-dependent dehydrogenase (short-subunit alcohol dehydrogenase family)